MDYMIHRGPFQPLPFCDSVNIFQPISQRNNILNWMSIKAEKRKRDRKRNVFLQNDRRFFSSKAQLKKNF